MDINEFQVPVIVDNGSYMCKAGLAGDDGPKSVFPSVVGKSRSNTSVVDSRIIDRYVGKKAQDKRGVLSLSYPIQNGVINDWETMEVIWHHAFSEELHIKPDEHPVLMTEPPYNPNTNREKMTEIMFEKFTTPAFYVAIPAHLAVYANGRVSSIVYDCGESVSHVIVVYEGHTAPYATQRTNIAGSEITSNFSRLLGERGHKFLTSSEIEIARGIKETLGYVALDFGKEMSKPSTDTETTYTLPDGKVITIGKERFRSTECIFDPTVIGVEDVGAHKLIHKCLQQCDIDMRRDLFCNIIMSGGSTMFRGFPERMEHEMRKLIPERAHFKIIAPPERKYSVWIGGSILTSLTFFERSWITKQAYEEEGATIVHRKCIRFQQAKKEYDVGP